MTALPSINRGRYKSEARSLWMLEKEETPPNYAAQLFTLQMRLRAPKAKEPFQGQMATNVTANTGTKFRNFPCTKLPSTPLDMSDRLGHHM